jgi:hypothetical protein
MGGSASRAGRLLPVLKPARDVVVADPLQHLPANSAVRRDAEAAVEMERKRIELEMVDVPLEELSGKDEEMVALMKNAMQRPDGEIKYKEHVLPLTEDSSLVQNMISQVWNSLVGSFSVSARLASHVATFSSVGGEHAIPEHCTRCLLHCRTPINRVLLCLDTDELF